MRRSSFCLLVLLALSILPAGGDCLANTLILDVTPAVTFVDAGQPFSIDVRIVSGPPALDCATIWLSLQFDPYVCHAYPSLAAHYPGNYIPSPAVIQLATAGGDYGVTDGKFDYEVVGFGMGSTYTSGTVSKNTMTAVGIGSVSTLSPKVVRLWNTQGTPIPVTPIILPATVYVNLITPTPTETPTLGPTETPTPTPEPTIIFSSAPIAPDVGRTLLGGHLDLSGKTNSIDYLELWDVAEHTVDGNGKRRVNGN